MTCWDIDQHRARARIVPGSVVVDVGASTGEFAVPAREQGASVVCVEVLAENCAVLRALGFDVIEAAAGPVDGSCRLIEATGPARPTGSHIDLTAGPVRMVSLASIVAYSGPVDVLKVDIEGGEYALFDGADRSTMESVAFLAVETHTWTVPGEPERVGLGVRPGPRCDFTAPERLVATLTRTHDVDVVGPLDSGALVVGVRREP